MRNRILVQKFIDVINTLKLMDKNGNDFKSREKKTNKIENLETN